MRALTAILLLLLSPCAPMTSEESKQSEVPLTIALVTKSYTEPYWLDAIAGGKQAAEELGVELLVISPKNETSIVEQVEIVENMIQRGVNGLVLAPCDSDALTQAVKRANLANIPVTTIDTDVNGGTKVTFVATDNFLNAKMAVDRLASHLNGRGQVSVISCPQTISTCRDLYQGFIEGLKMYPDLDLVGAPLGVPFCDQSFNATMDLLQAHQNLQGIYVFGGQAIMCAVEAAKAYGKQLGENFWIVARSSTGKSGVMELKAVRDGELDAAVVQFPFQMGFQGVKSIVDYYEGKTFPRFTDTGVALVTKENVGEFIEAAEQLSGSVQAFHTNLAIADILLGEISSSVHLKADLPFGGVPLLGFGPLHELYTVHPGGNGRRVAHNSGPQLIPLTVPPELRPGIGQNRERHQ